MPIDPQAQVAEAWAAFQTGDLDKAEAILKAIVESGGDRVPALIALGMVADASGRKDVAIQRMHEALTIDLRCVPALNWLSKLSLDTSKLDDAVQFGERAIGVAPNNAESLQILLNAYMAGHRYLQALDICDRALKLAPKDPNLHYRKAEVLEGLARETSAIEPLKRAIALAPSLRGLVKLARLELNLGRADDAIETARNALQLDPNNPGIHIVLARAFTETLMLDEAGSHWAKARSMLPNAAIVNLERARSLTYIGQFAAAEAELMQAIDLDNMAVGAYQALVASKKITEQDRSLIDRMERQLANPATPGQLRMELCFALGKAFDNLQDYERAMQMFDEANRLLAAHSPRFNRRDSRAFADLQISTFTPEFFARFRSEGLESQLPLFVVGMMRSGTTLAEQVLTCHSQIGGSGEQAFWSEHVHSIVNWQHSTVNSGQIKRFGNQYLKLLISLAPGFSTVIDKNPANAMILGVLHLAFPNSKIVHMRRNAIDTALSIWMTQLGTGADFVGERESIVYAYKQYLRMMEHWRAVLPPSQILDVRYESLIGDPASTTRQLTNFLSLEWEEACVHPEQNPHAVRTPSFWQVRQPFFKTSTEKWKRYAPWLGAFQELEGL